MELSPKSAAPTESRVAADDAPKQGSSREIALDSGHGLSRSLTSRHLLMFSIGSAIGMGMWLGSGMSLVDGGPAALFIGYAVAGSIAWAVNQAIGELAILYPVPSAFPQWASKFIDRSAAFTVGWAYWFNCTITLSNELQACNTVLSYWTQAVPVAAWISIFLVLIFFVSVCGVRAFGEIEVLMSTVKLFWIVVVVISFIVISAGGAPTHQRTGFHWWNVDPFTHGFKGFLSVLSTCVFALAGAELGGLTAAEAADPRRSVSKAVNTIWMRLAFFYLIGSLVITITVSPKDPDLFGNSGVSASPFVVAYKNAGLGGLAHAMNAVIFVSVLSSGNAQAYGATRTLVGLGEIGIAPRLFAWCDSHGRPWPSVALTFLIGGGLSYLNVDNSGSTVFTWFSDLTTLCVLWTWGTVFVCHLRFRAAWRAQGHAPADLPWRTWTWPFATIWGLVWCILIIIVEFYLAVWPLGQKPSAKNFFSNYVSMVAILAILIGTKLWFRGPLWIRAKDVDLDTGRRQYPATEDEEASSSAAAAAAVGDDDDDDDDTGVARAGKRAFSGVNKVWEYLSGDTKY